MNYCTQCQGHCCKTNPGPTVPADWGAPDIEVMRERLTRALDAGTFVLGHHGEHFWMVRPAQLPNGHCILLRENGCSLSESERPAACRALTPSAYFPEGCYYPGEVTLNGRRSDMVYWGIQWLPYKKLLLEIAVT
jgi:Fe-S-cluster containining protein